MKDDLGRFDVPSVRSPAWAGATLPLLGYVRDVPRSIDDIVVWGRSNGRSGSTIRHMLAWLSFEGFVHYAVAPKVWKIGEEPRSRLGKR